MQITTGAFNGNMKWEASFTVPGETYVSFAEAEVPLADVSFGEPQASPKTDDGHYLLIACVLLVAIDIAIAYKRKKAQP